jgi:exodeoxyribonuclease-3
MKIATYNANSIRVRLPSILEWLAEHKPDLLAIQETKVEDDKFPEEEFLAAGWQACFHGQKSYNGVAILTRGPLSDVRFGFEDPLFPDDRRIIRAKYEGIEFINTYVPNGTKVGTEKFDYKLRWLDRFRQMLQTQYAPGTPLIWLGDINIAPKPEDVFDSAKKLGGVGHHPKEFEALSAIVDTGLIDLFRKFHQGSGHYTYWEFFIPKAFERNLGWRIDHIYATPDLADRCTNCWIDREPRGWERPSDHTYVIAELS